MQELLWTLNQGAHMIGVTSPVTFPWGALGRAGEVTGLLGQAMR